MSLRNPNSRFVLDHKSKKVTCPNCKHNGVFRMYIDRHTGNNLPHHVGICERINSCQYSYSAVQWIKDGGEIKDVNVKLPPPKMKLSTWRCPENVVAATRHYDGNAFAMWLASVVGDEAALAALSMYRVGTYPAGKNNPHLTGSMIYWQIGSDGKERSGKIIPYGPDGKRIKSMGSQWVHSVITGKSMEELGCAQCLFGEHLIYERPAADVCVVESEKSAIICSIFYPDKIWVATGGSHGLTVGRCMPLQGANVWIFPDVGMYQDWSKRALDIDVMCESLVVSDVMEAAGMEEGSDLADYLIYPGEGGYYNMIAAMELDLFPARSIDPEPVAETPVITAEPVRPPIERLTSMPGVQALIREMDLDMTTARVKPLEQ